jgi:hypothetical protein
MGLFLQRTFVLAMVIALLAPQEARAQPDPVRVIVNRREVRVVFPRDTARAWGWSARKEPGYYPFYIWGISVEGMDGPRSLLARVDRERDEPRDFASLVTLVASARAALCLPGMFGPCDSSHTRATVDDGRVVLTLRDSAQIARRFGMRPAFVRVWQERHAKHERFADDSARVEYIAPQIPLPDAATREDAARSQRRYEASITTISRYITGGIHSGSLWLEVGDSAAVSVTEMQCHYDVCTSAFSTPLDSGWTIADPSIARLQLAKPNSSDTVFILGGAPRYVKALRPGRTTMRVRGIHSPSDTAPSSKPPERELAREIIVTPPIERVEIAPRPDTVRVGEIITLHVRALDHEGRDFAGLPWQLEVLDGENRGIHIGPEAVSLGFTVPGRARIAARLGIHTDTITVTAIATPGAEHHLRSPKDGR